MHMATLIEFKLYEVTYPGGVRRETPVSTVPMGNPTPGPKNVTWAILNNTTYFVRVKLKVRNMQTGVESEVMATSPDSP
jgi:hypothetical protein